MFYLLNYQLWDTLQDQNEGRPRATRTVRIVDEWDKLDQRIMDKVIGEWRKRLRACVVTGGGQFEHKM